MLVTGCVGITKCEAQENSPHSKHSFGMAAYTGTDLMQKAPLFGADAGYEYRLGKHWALTAAFSLGYGRRNNPRIFDGNNNDTRAQNLEIWQSALHGGVKYYFNRFYVTAGFGAGDENEKVNYPNNYNYGTYSQSGLYQTYGLGYQLPLKKGNNLEIFMKGFGVRDLNVATGIRYSFNMGKKK